MVLANFELLTDSLFNFNVSCTTMYNGLHVEVYFFPSQAVLLVHLLTTSSGMTTYNEHPVLFYFRFMERLQMLMLMYLIVKRFSLTLFYDL